MRFFILSFLLIINVSIPAAQDYSIVDFGAVPDARLLARAGTDGNDEVGQGKTMNTSAIQSAIDAAYKKGGGRVIVPEGIFLTGSIILKSGVELHLLDKAVLLGSTNPDHYSKLNRWKALILADGQNNWCGQ